jgi:hypothetical protein
MNPPAHVDHMNGHGGTNLSLTPEFTPVIAPSYGHRPFKRLAALASSGTRLKPGVNGK